MKKSSWLLLFLAFSIFSCSVIEDVENLSPPAWEPDFSFPLVDTDVTVNELLDEWDTQRNIKVDENGLLFISQQADIFSVDGEGIYEIPDLLIPVIDTALVGPNPFQDIELFTLKEGSMEYAIDLSLVGEHVITLLIENITSSDGVFTREIRGSGPGRLEGVWDLGRSNFDFREDSIRISYTADHVPTGQRIMVFPFSLNLTDMDFSYAQGYFGQHQFEVSADTIELDSLGDEIDIEYMLSQAELSLTTTNSFGIPVRLAIDNFNLVTEEGETLGIESEVISNGIDFNYPTLEEIGQEKTTSIILNEQNSNIHTALSLQPKVIRYGLSAMAHPENDPEERGFITDTSHIDVSMDVYVPLYGSIRQFSRTDTFSLSLEDLDMGRYARFKIIGDNEIPLDIFLQGYFLDEQDQIIDSLVNTPFAVLESPDVDANGEVIESKRTESFIEIQEAKFNRLTQTSSMVLRYTLATGENGTAAAKFLSDSKLDVKIGLQIGVQNPD
ncbi:MAG: hypothetical protein AAF824_12925 [Bacteroidota bacterium]